MKTTKHKIISRIKANFSNVEETNNFNYNRVDFKVKKETIPSILFYLKENMGYIHLSHISCIDWIEEGEFELVFILWSPEEKITVFVKTRIDRENPQMENIDTIWRQANTYERELREMYGIQFVGLVAPDDFILEDWQGPPPMRREFDTEAYSNETFFNRPGREDAQDVRENIIERTGEDIPDFAKKYSR